MNAMIQTSFVPGWAITVPLVIALVLCVWAAVDPTVVSRNQPEPKPKHRLHKPLVRTKYLVVDWSPKRPGGRRWAWKHRRNVKSIYMQVLALEVAVWYGDVKPDPRCAKAGCKAPSKWTVRPWNFEERREEPLIRLCDKHLHERMRSHNALRPS